MKHVLGLFAKWPQPGAVKTRLAAQTSPDFAARVAMAFLLDCLERYGGEDATRVLAFSPEEEKANFARIVANRWLLEPQGDGDLGARLRRFFDRQFACGAKTVVVIGTDSPTQPCIVAGPMFARHDVSIGPTMDGGYYLLGLSRPVPELFVDIDWSGPEVLHQTVSRLDPSIKLKVLPPWYDVDTLDDWRALRGHFAAERRAGYDPRAPRTEALALAGEFCGISEAL